MFRKAKRPERRSGTLLTDRGKVSCWLWLLGDSGARRSHINSSATWLWATAALEKGRVTLSTRNRWRWEAYLDRLKAEPGLVVVATGNEGGQYLICGLRDLLAADPTALLRETPIRPEQVVGQWEPYQSLASAFVLARAKSLLAASRPRGAILVSPSSPLSHVIRRR